jgi:hypothetical protein
LFERLKIAHPLIEYNDEALKLVLSLKDRIKEPGVINNKAQVDELVFENICQRRLILTKKLLILDAFNNIFRTTITKGNYCNKITELNNNDLDSFCFEIEGIEFNLKQLFWTLKFSVKLYNDDLNPSSIIKTRKYLDENFDFDNYCIKSPQNSIELKNTSVQTYEKTCVEQNCTCGLNLQSNVIKLTGSSTRITNSPKNNNRGGCINLQQEKNYKSENVITLSLDSSHDKESKNLISNSENLEIEGYKERLIKQQQNVKILEDEKNRLESQKIRAETILGLLKNFVRLKDYYQNNRSKCAFMLSFVKSVREGENSFNDLRFIQDIVDFFLDQFENIQNGDYDDFEVIEFLVDEESLIDVTYETKLGFIDESFAVMESELHYHIRDILNDNTD